MQRPSRRPRHLLDEIACKVVDETPELCLLFRLPSDQQLVQPRASHRNQPFVVVAAELREHDVTVASFEQV